jgi:hypothetical protein
VKTPNSAGWAAVDARSRSPVPSSHAHEPSVTTGRMRSDPLCSTQWAISLPTHSERAASGEERRMNQRAPSRASTIEVHRCGLAERPVWSRNTRSARRRYHGLA